MKRRWWVFYVRAALMMSLIFLALHVASAQTADKPASVERGFFDFIKAGGMVGYVLIALSFLGGGLVIDSFLHIRIDRLIPSGLVEQAEDLARKGKFSQILPMCKAGDSVIARILAAGMAQGAFGLPAVRQAMQEQGTREVTRLTHRINYMGFLGAIGPMMGLLGTVIGMISSFNVLGSSKGSSRPDELASGIAFALTTTCEGLVVAIPMMFFHNYFRDRVTKLGLECAAACERVLRIITALVEARNMPTPRPAVAQAAETAAPAVAASAAAVAAQRATSAAPASALQAAQAAQAAHVAQATASSAASASAAVTDGPDLAAVEALEEMTSPKPAPVHEPQSTVISAPMVYTWGAMSIAIDPQPNSTPPQG
jgi:biopolymer transport protein ExbB